MKFMRMTLATADSNACNSLAGITGYSDLDTTYVQQPNHWFRFFSASTEAPDGVLVIRPDDIQAADPGRWIRQGPPAQYSHNFFDTVNQSSCDVFPPTCAQAPIVLSTPNTGVSSIPLTGILTALGLASADPGRLERTVGLRLQAALRINTEGITYESDFTTTTIVVDDAGVPTVGELNGTYDPGGATTKIGALTTMAGGVDTIHLTGVAISLVSGQYFLDVTYATSSIIEYGTIEACAGPVAVAPEE